MTDSKPTDETGQPSPPAPHRILLLTTELRTGGAERCVARLALGLDRRRFDVKVASLAPRPRGKRGGLAEELEAGGIALEFLDSETKWQFFPTLLKLRKLLREVRPHLLHSFLFHANVLGAVAADRGLPRITSLRVADPSKFRWRLERWAAKKATLTTCVSEQVREKALRAGFDDKKLIITQNGVDLGRFENVPPIDCSTFGIPPGAPIMVCIGRLEPQKGVDWLIELAPRILEACPSWHLLFVGEGELETAYRRQARASSAAERIHFSGWQTDIPGVLAASNLYLLPSRWEGMPNTMLEAMAAGLPVVSTKVSGAAALLAKQHDGFQQVDIGDAEGFIAKAVKIGNSPELAAELGQENQQRVREDFLLADEIASYERLYMRLLDG